MPDGGTCNPQSILGVAEQKLDMKWPSQDPSMHSQEPILASSCGELARVIQNCHLCQVVRFTPTPIPL